MEELKIQLTFNPDHFRELYYRNGQGDIFRYKPTRNVILIPVVLIVSTTAIFFVSYTLPGISWLVGLGILGIIATVAYALITIVKYKKWKDRIETFVRNLAKHNSYQLHATENAIEVALDEEISIETWGNIKSVQIEQDYILLRNDKEILYLFPAKSMKADEFEKLKEMIRSQVK